MKTRFLALAIALACSATAAVSPTTFSTRSLTDVNGITNLLSLSSLPAEYTDDGSRIGGVVNAGGATAFVSTLTDRQALLASEVGKTENNSLNQFAVVDGDSLTYSLGGSFNLTRIEIYNSWNDHGRDDFNNVTIQFSTNGTDFFDLVSGLATSGTGTTFIQGTSTNGELALRNTGIFADGEVIVDNATHVRFIFNGLEAGEIGISELAVQGTSAIPEPSTYAAIFGALALGAAAYCRRQARA